jgi:hypothetical protein
LPARISSSAFATSAPFASNLRRHLSSGICPDSTRRVGFPVESGVTMCFAPVELVDYDQVTSNRSL